MSTATLDPQSVPYIIDATGLPARSIMSVLTLLVTEQCTVPFISRYRKEVTGGMDEIQIRAIQEHFETYTERENRRVFILDTIKKMEKMTPELEKKILNAKTIEILEDIYAPFKSKKKTKGQIAKDAGLEPLAIILLNATESLKELMEKHEKTFINVEHKITNFKEAIQGAADIIIEMVTHDTELKEKLRQDYWNDAYFVSTKKDKIEGVDQEEINKYKDYFEYKELIKELKNPKACHRFLAMRRGMNQKVLKLDVSYSEEQATATVAAKYLKNSMHESVSHVVNQCALKAYKDYIHSSLDLEVKTELKKHADESAISVFGINLKNLLLQPYLGSKTVLGVDPGVRTGCKIVVVDNTGKYVVDTVIYPHPPRQAVNESRIIMEAIIDQFKVEHIAIGNGTYGRETLAFFEENVKQVKEGKTHATMISEAGASVYSASEIAGQEFPDKDVTVRGSISIARRFQDPLAELVKIDPKAIGVGQYQHDVNESKLKKSLDGVVESCVNFVGVDINTASAPLLSYVSGIGPALAQNIVKMREKKGTIKSRKDLLEVPRFTQKIFEQAAGFLRIYTSENPLDRTFIHPERYEILENWAKKNGQGLNDLVSNKDIIAQLEKDISLKKEIGEFTFADIVKALKAPSQDPRTIFKSIEFRKDVTSIKDLKINEWYTGQVNNITQFGAFVDIGIKESGLLHVSQMSDRFVENALEELKVGQEIKVRVTDIDYERKRISLSCKTTDSKSAGSFSQDRTSSSSSRPMKAPPVQEIRNNAFAGLKNLKL